MCKPEVCDVCTGSKVTLTGESCMCKDGTLYGFLTAMRLENFILQQKLAEANEIVDRLLDDITKWRRDNGRTSQGR